MTGPYWTKRQTSETNMDPTDDKTCDAIRAYARGVNGRLENEGSQSRIHRAGFTYVPSLPELTEDEELEMTARARERVQAYARSINVTLESTADSEDAGKA